MPPSPTMQAEVVIDWLCLVGLNDDLYEEGMLLPHLQFLTIPLPHPCLLRFAWWAALFVLSGVLRGGGAECREKARHRRKRRHLEIRLRSFFRQSLKMVENCVRHFPGVRLTIKGGSFNGGNNGRGELSLCLVVVRPFVLLF